MNGVKAPPFRTNEAQLIHEQDIWNDSSAVKARGDRISASLLQATAVSCWLYKAPLKYRIMGFAFVDR